MAGVWALTEGVRMNQYEIAVLYHPDLEVDLEKATSRVEKIFTDNGGKVTPTGQLGQAQAGLQHQAQRVCYLRVLHRRIAGENVRKVESTLNITDEVIRFLITKPDLKAIAKAEAAKAEKAEQAAKRGERLPRRRQSRSCSELGCIERSGRRLE
jgi:ribosomal protein S6